MNTSIKVNSNEEHNIYDKYISGTEKLWKNEKSNFIQEYILDKKVIGRKFLINDSISYYEIFEDKRLNILGQSEKISLLSFSKEDNPDLVDTKNCFGFRYYEKNKSEKCNYFTLIKKGKKGYYILEKTENIKDIDNESFFDKDLDCYSIMKNIVYDNYKEININKNSTHGDLFSEFIGYIYSMIYLAQFKNFIVVEPFIPNLFEKESLIEEIPSSLEDSIGYIEPILYGNHVSILLIIKDENYIRKNYLFDMSKHYSEKNIFDHTLFPLDMINNLIIYPKNNIKKNNSNGLWFYGILELIYSNNKYHGPQDVLNKIVEGRSDFLIDVVNLLSEKIYGLKDMVNFRDIHESENNVYIGRIYDCIIGKKISYLKECINNNYIPFSLKYDWIRFYTANFDMKLLFKYEKLIEEIKNYKRQIEMNNDYFKEYSEQDYYNNNIKNSIEHQLQRVINLHKFVNINFFKELMNNIIKNFNRLKKIIDIKYLELEKKFKLVRKMNVKNIDELQIDLMQIKNNYKSFKLLDESTIVHNLNPNNDILFILLNN